MRVLMVCTGNICRSPLAMALMRHHLDQQGCDGVEVVSAGVSAVIDAPASRPAVRVLHDRGIDLTDHRARHLTRAELERADLVVVMAQDHLDAIRALAPETLPKVARLKDLARRSITPMPGTDRAGRLQALLAATPPAELAALDVADPYGRSLDSYATTAEEIERGVDALVRVLCG
jgi:protein-tyrosine phosphatase